MPASRVSPEVRAAAIADLLAGEQPAIVAERYHLNRNTVKSWLSRFTDAPVPASARASIAVTDAPAAPIVQPSVEARKGRIAELVLDLLAAKLEASRRLTAHLSDPAFLAQQSYEQLVGLNGYFDRSALTLGDRLAGAEDDEPAAGGGADVP